MGSRYYKWQKEGSSGAWTKQDGTSYFSKEHQLFFADLSTLVARAALTAGTDGVITFTANVSPLVAQADVITPAQEIRSTPAILQIGHTIQATHEIAQDIGILDAQGQVLAPTGEVESGVTPFVNQGHVIGLAAVEVRDDLSALVKQAAMITATFDLVPDTPQNFTAKRNASLDDYATVELSCDAVDGASHYEWYRASGQRASYSLHATTTSPSYSDTGLDKTIPYSYSVLAKTSDGTRGPRTKSIYTRGKRTHV